MYETEEEQVKALKDWWSENGTSIIVGVVLGVGGFFGYNWWQDSIVSNQEQGSVAFEALTEIDVQNNFDEFKQKAESIKTDYAKTGYGLVAALHLAKQQVEKGEFDAAVKQLEWAVAQTEGQKVQSLIKIRLANALAANEQFDAAEKYLSEVSDSAFDALKQQALGDIYRHQGKTEDARAAYQLAQQNTESFGLRNQLDMMIDDLAVVNAVAPESSLPGKPAPQGLDEEELESSETSAEQDTQDS